MVIRLSEDPSNGHLSGLVISQLLAHDIPPESGQPWPVPEKSLLHLASCAECQAALAAARSQVEQFANQYPTLESLDAKMRMIKNRKR